MVNVLCVLCVCCVGGGAQVVYEIPSPGPVSRMEILKYHARNKQLDNEGLLKKVAEVTQVSAFLFPQQGGSPLGAGGAQPVHGSAGRANAPPCSEQPAPGSWKWGSWRVDADMNRARELHTAAAPAPALL